MDHPHTLEANNPAGKYDDAFFSYTTAGALTSARIIIPVLKDLLPKITSAVDFGCAQGAWLNIWKENGTTDLLGIDGNYVNPDSLTIEKSSFKAANLSSQIDLGRKFDLAYSFEVADHIDAKYADIFINNLIRHADFILFSASPPGQGGEHHINEQPYDYWRQIFAKYGYVAIDCVRPAIAHLKDVSFWYRYNIILYVQESSLKNLPPKTLAAKVPAGLPIADISPPLFKLRKAIVSILPESMQNWIARLKSRANSTA